MYGTVVSLPMLDYHTFVSYFFLFFYIYHFARVWPTALKLGCVTNLDMLFLVMWFISLLDEIQFMLISSRHICIRSLSWADFRNSTVTSVIKSIPGLVFRFAPGSCVSSSSSSGMIIRPSAVVWKPLPCLRFTGLPGSVAKQK